MTSNPIIVTTLADALTVIAIRERKIERLTHELAVQKMIEDAMTDCIEPREGQTFEERAEELIVTEVQHQQCSAHETTDHISDAVAGVLTDACMILDVVKGEWAEAWSEWDQGVRDRITRLLVANHEARSGSKETRRLGLAAQIDAAKKRIAAWPADVRAALGLPEEPSPRRCHCGQFLFAHGMALITDEHAHEHAFDGTHCDCEGAPECLPEKASATPTQEWIDRSQGLTGLQYDESGERLPENGSEP